MKAEEAETCLREEISWDGIRLELSSLSSLAMRVHAAWIQALPGNELLRDLPLELNAVETLPGHDFYPLKAQLTLLKH
jgi:hypothetical protein